MKEKRVIRKEICLSLIKSRGFKCDSDICLVSAEPVCPVHKRYENVVEDESFDCACHVNNDQAYDEAYDFYIRYYGEDRLVEDLL